MSLGIRLEDRPDLIYTIPARNFSHIDLSTNDSKTIRINTGATVGWDLKLISGLERGETLRWGEKVRKLSSTRHKNIILRIAHGDIYSNDRLN